MTRRSKRLAVLPCDGCGAQCCHMAPFTHEELSLAMIANGGLPQGAVVMNAGRLKAKFGGREIVMVIQPGTVKCAFVDEDSRCMIYDARPHACRAYGVHKDLPCQRLEPQRAEFLGKRALRELGLYEP